MLHDAIEILADLIEVPDIGDGLHGLLQRLQGIASVGTGIGHVARDGGPAGQDYVVSQRDMRGHHGIAAGDELPADLRGSPHHEAGREEAVLAQVAVVRNMTNIIQLGAGSDVGRRQRGAVDCAIAADLDSIADDDVAQVRDFSRPPVRIHGVAEAIAADAGMRMYLTVIADPATGTDEDMRVQHASVADPGVVLDDGVSADHAVVADARTRSDHAIRPEEGALSDRGIRVRHRSRMALAPLSESIALPVEVFQ